MIFFGFGICILDGVVIWGVKDCFEVWGVFFWVWLSVCCGFCSGVLVGFWVKDCDEVGVGVKGCIVGGVCVWFLKGICVGLILRVGVWGWG